MFKGREINNIYEEKVKVVNYQVDVVSSAEELIEIPDRSSMLCMHKRISNKIDYYKFWKE
jgi:hypothetical protein